MDTDEGERNTEFHQLSRIEPWFNFPGPTGHSANNIIPLAGWAGGHELLKLGEVASSLKPLGGENIYRRIQAVCPLNLWHASKYRSFARTLSKWAPSSWKSRLSRGPAPGIHEA